MLIPSMTRKVKLVNLKRVCTVLAISIFVGLFVVGLFSYGNSPEATTYEGWPIGWIIYGYIINGLLFAMGWISIAILAALVIAGALVMAGFILSVVISFAALLLIIALDRVLKPMRT